MRMQKGSRRMVLGAAAGAMVGLALFLLESLVAMRAGAIGPKLDVAGSLEPLMQAAKPQLPGLLLRVAIAYCLWGVVFGAASAALASALPIRGRRFWLLAGAEFAVLSVLLTLHRAVSRPALVDDLPPLQGGLEWLINHAEPWHIAVAAACWLIPHAVLALRRLERRWVARGAVLAASATALGWLISRNPRSESRHPLVIVLGVDAMRPDRLGAYGGRSNIAPNLETFALEATVFDRAYTPIAQTEPAWRSLLTARWPHRHGDRYPLTAESRLQPAPTFAEKFARAGYQTTFFTDCSRFNYQGAASGFAERHQPPAGAINFILEKLRYRGLGMFADNRAGARFLPELIDNRALAGIHDPIGYAHRLAQDLVTQAKKAPLLFAYHAAAAHFPGDPVYPFYRRWVPASEPLERRLRMSFAPIGATSEGNWTREGSEALYDELLSQADAQVGIIFDALKASGLYDDALIVVFSDHGESFHADRPSLAGATPVHGSRLGDEENQIVLGIKLPRGAGQVAHNDALVRLVDIGPTLLQLRGLGELPDADGQSLVPLLRGEPMAPLRLYAETGFTHVSPDAFDPDHLVAAPRTLNAYRIRLDGVIEVTDDVHEALLREKDIGTFDGSRWIIRSPRKDGSFSFKCLGDCANPEDAIAWLEEVE